MHSLNMLVPLEDVLYLMKVVIYCEKSTVGSLLKLAEEDLNREEKPIENLRALHYFMVHASRTSSTFSRSVIIFRSALKLFKLLSDKDKVHLTLLASILESSLCCLSHEELAKELVFAVGFIETELNKVSACSSSFLDSSKNLSHALVVLEKLCCSIISNPELVNIVPLSLIDQIITICFELPLDVSRAIFVSTLPKLVISQCCNSCLHMIWNKISHLTVNNGELETQLFYLCVLADHFIVITPTTNKYPLYDQPILWEILQRGLIDENNLIRKQALYLLKRYISVLENSDIQTKSPNFFWCTSKKEELVQFWNQIFILSELLEEKQTHIIMPAFNNIQELFLFCNSNEHFYFSWLYCIFFRVMNHSSTTLVKWGIKEFCSLRTDVLFDDMKCNLLLSSLFKVLNNMFFFNTLDNVSDYNLESSLTEWFTSISMDKNALSVKSTLEVLVNSSWSPVPLFHVINALSNVPEVKVLDSDCYNLINKILIETLKTQCIFIRSAIQCQLLKCITKLSDTSIETSTIINILGNFNGEESLSRGSGMWNNCVDWLKKMFDSKNGSDIIKSCKNRLFSVGIQTISIHSYTRGILLFNDAGLLKCDELNNLLSSVTEPFMECEKRVYSCPIIQDNCSEFLKCIIDETSITSKKKPVDGIILLIKPVINNVIQSIRIRLKRGPLETVEQVKLYEKVLCSIFNCPILHDGEFFCGFQSFYKFAFDVLGFDNLTFFQEYLSIKIICLAYEFILKNKLGRDKFVIPFRNDIIELVFRKRLFCKSSLQICSSINSEPNLKGKLMSETMKTLWHIFNTNLKFHCYSVESVHPILEIFPISNLLNYALASISEDGKQALVPILKSFVILFPYNEDINVGVQFISESWDACFELRKSELFWLSIKEWISMVYQENILQRTGYHQIIINKAKKITEYGEELVGLVDIFMDQLNTLYVCPEFVDIIISGLTFGPITKKDKRIEYDVSQEILKKVEDGSMHSFGKWTELKSDKEVRLKAMNLLLNEKSQYINENIKLVINELLLLDEYLSKNNKRYFNDSPNHRRKHRICEALLILEYYIYNNPSHHFEGLPEKIFTWAYESLQGTNQQPSVRYQLEWIFILLCIHYPRFCNNFWDLFEKAGGERLGSMCSFISISYHLAVVTNNDEFLEKAITSLIPWCMSQNFNIRLYAQVALSKLWDLNPDISQRYDFIRLNQWKTCEQGNMLANAKKMQTDFYFSVFHPIHHFNLKTIYWDLPRLSNISSEEWINPALLKNYAHFNIDNKPCESIPSLESFISPTWISRATANTEGESDGGSIQKKFIPWKGMFPDSDRDSKRNTSGIIIVASLIDKAANLGGLARTCEIFAAKELVLPSLEMTKDKEFVGLSMTAEKHLLISEVRPYNLQEYLKVMKNMGYVLVGAEQTTGSVCLVNATFPKDCVLLLGSEREGIPANVIPLLDMCVEIPQLGLLRSLNVHVSGALILWEYTKQHSLNHP